MNKYLLVLISFLGIISFSACNNNKEKNIKNDTMEKDISANVKNKTIKKKLNEKEIENFEISIGLLKTNWEEFKVSESIYLYINKQYPNKSIFNKNIKRNLNKSKKIIYEIYSDFNKYDIDKYLLNSIKELKKNDLTLRKEDETLVKALKLDINNGYLNALFSSCVISNINIDIIQDSVNFAESNKLNDRFLSQLKKLRSIEYKNFWIIDRELKKLGIKEGCVTYSKKKKKTIPKD